MALDEGTGWMTLSRLKWVAIVVPLAFLAVLYALVHSSLSSIHDFPASLVLLVIAASGVGLFSFAVFEVVSRLEQHVLEQNRLLEQGNRELAALLAVGRASSSSIDLHEVLAKALEATLEATSAEAAEVWLTTDSGELELARHGGAASEAFAERTRLQSGEGLPGRVAAQGEPIIVRDLVHEERFIRPKVKTAGFDTYLGLPLVHQGRTVGVLGVAAKDSQKLSVAGELRLVEGIGELLATAIENVRLHERVLDGAVIEERVRIARELHDGLAQILGYINTQTLAVRKLLDSDRVADARQELTAMETAARNVYTDVREAILGLRSATATDEGLVPSLRHYLGEYGQIAGLRVELLVDGPVDRVVLPRSTEIQLVRIVQEALTNVRKHARASHASVRLALSGERLRVEVRDDGCGFHVAASTPTGWPRFGIKTMHERAAAVGATLSIDSAPAGGTTVAVNVPLPEEVRRESAAG